MGKSSMIKIKLNSGKKSISVDLKDERGLKIIRELVKASDVVVENFRYTIHTVPIMITPGCYEGIRK